MTTKKPKLPIHKIEIAIKLFLARYPYRQEEQLPKETLSDFVFYLENEI